MAKLPEFKADYKYSNVGTVIGKITYISDLVSKAGNQYGKKFLVNVKGYGSVDIRVPSVQKAQEITEQFQVGENARFGLVTVDSFHSKTTGKTYTNFTTFATPSDAVTANGNEMDNRVAGKIGGEVAKITNENGHTVFWLVSYRVDKDGNQIKNRNGDFLPPLLIKLDVVDNDVKKEFDEKVQEGTNVEVGYVYVNKDDVSFDEFGLPLGSGQKVQRLEAKRIIVHKNQKQVVKKEKSNWDSDPFGDVFGGIEISDSDIPF